MSVWDKEKSAHVAQLEKQRHAHRATERQCLGAKAAAISLAKRLIKIRSFKSVQGHDINASTTHHPLTAVSSTSFSRVSKSV